MTLTIRPARPGEAATLTGLALRSKAHWGYDQAFLDACRPELTFSDVDVARGRFHVAEQDGRVIGFHSVDGVPPDGELGNLWVEPDLIGTGVGRALWSHARAHAEALGFRTLRIDADPYAEGFYLAMGALRIGSSPSGSIPGRVLPTLRIAVA